MKNDADDRQAKHELSIFSRFAAAVKLAVVPNSIQKRQPPEPDILCSIDGRGDGSFELGEIIDQSMARRDSDVSKLYVLLDETFKNFSDEKRVAFLSRYQHSSIRIAFQEKVTYKARANAVTAVLDLLLSSAEPVTGLDRFAEYREDFERIYRCAEFTHADEYVRVVFPRSRRSPLFLLKKKSQLLNTIDQLNVSQCDHFQGPSFYVNPAGFFGERALQAIQKKFKKTYSTATPIELLAFYESQPVQPAELWLPQLSSYIEQNIGPSPFKKVHVFDAAKNEVLFQSPTCRKGTRPGPL